MIFVDSSVWIDHLRGHKTPQVLELFQLVRGDEDSVVGDLVPCEVLKGVPTERITVRVERDLREFEVVSMLDDDLAVEAARNFRQLRRLGVAIQGTIGLLIGTYCTRHRHRLLHADRDYDAMERHLGLSALHP